MRFINFTVAVACLAFFSANAVIAKEKSSKAAPKLMVPTLPPPTAEWPEFPPVTKPESAPASAATAAPSVPADALPSPPAGTPSVSTGAEASATTSLTPPEGNSSTPSPTATQEAAAAPVSAAQMEPHKRPVPEGYDAAAALYKQKKFPQAAKAFEAIIQKGTANVDTHLSLAYCYLLQRLYSKAAKEFEWVAKYGKNSMTLQKQAGQTATSLRTYIAGVCPAPCLKANDPRWVLKNDGKRWITVSYSRKATWNFSEHHVGEYVANENGIPVLKGTCPVCEGTGRVKPLKDGDPPPRL